MERKTWSTTYSYAKNIEECSDEDRLLLNEASAAMKGSHAPYSKFHVGAAILLDNGQIIHGSNQENASFPLGLCAERTAISAKASISPGAKIQSIAITVHSNLKLVSKPAAPCGICRQVLLESELSQHQNIRIILKGSTGPVLIFESIKDLMPFYFGAEDF